MTDTQTPLALNAAPTPDMMPITGTIMLEIGGESVPALLTASLNPAPFEALLPIFHGIADALVERGVAREAAAGRQLSCRAGCGACCRQAVPLSASEARAIAALVTAMPEARRAAVTARFEAARAALTNAKLPTDPAEIAAMDRDGRNSLGARYFALGIACPFLEAESCSIHPDRPVACREYLVTSPPENCAAPTGSNLRGVPLAGTVSQAVLAQDAEAEGAGVVVLVDALDFAARHPAPPQESPGIELALKVIAHIPSGATA